jgi:hypothetical protein
MAVGDVTFSSNLTRSVCLMTGQTANTGAPSADTDGVPAHHDETIASSSITGAFYTGETPDVSTLTINSTAGSGTMTGTFTLWGYRTETDTWYSIQVNGGSAIGETSANAIEYTEEVSVGRFDRIFLQLASVGGTDTEFEAHLTTAREAPRLAGLITDSLDHENRIGDLEDDVAEAQPLVAGTPGISVAAQSGTHRDATVQLKDATGTALAAKAVARIWISDAAAGALTASAPAGGVSFTTGTGLSLTANKMYDVVSDATGVIVVRLTDATSPVNTTWYVNVAIGLCVVSAAVNITNA